MSKLLPCPFCGSDAKRDGRIMKYPITCVNDDCTLAIHYMDEEEWNTRAEPTEEQTKKAFWAACEWFVMNGEKRIQRAWEEFQAQITAMGEEQ